MLSLGTGAVGVPEADTWTDKISTARSGTRRRGTETGSPKRDHFRIADVTRPGGGIGSGWAVAYSLSNKLRFRTPSRQGRMCGFRGRCAMDRTVGTSVMRRPVSDPSGLIGCSSFTTFWGLDLCQSVSIVENEAIGVAKAAGDTASAVVHPVRTWQAWDSACQAGLNGPGGLLQCIDNVNPFGAGGVRGQIQQTWNDLNNGCPSQVGQDIGTLQFEAALSYGGGAAAAKVAERLKLLKARVNEMKAVRAADKAAKAAESVSAKVADKFNRVRAIAKDHGLNVPEFGGGYLWANKDANLALQTPEQLAEVKARGFTKSEINTIRDYYRAVDSASTGTNPSAGYRAQLMQYYLDNWRK